MQMLVIRFQKKVMAKLIGVTYPDYQWLLQSYHSITDEVTHLSA